MNLTQDLPAWHLDAACRDADPTLFFPEVGHGKWTVPQARAVCDTCRVTEECLVWALENREQHGIWGGMTLKERRKEAVTRGYTADGMAVWALHEDSVPARCLAVLATDGGWLNTEAVAGEVGVRKSHVERSLWRLHNRGQVSHRPVAEWRAA